MDSTKLDLKRLKNDLKSIKKRKRFGGSDIENIAENALEKAIYLMGYVKILQQQIADLKIKE